MGLSSRIHRGQEEIKRGPVALWVCGSGHRLCSPGMPWGGVARSPPRCWVPLTCLLCLSYCCVPDASLIPGTKHQFLPKGAREGREGRKGPFLDTQGETECRKKDTPGEQPEARGTPSTMLPTASPHCILLLGVQKLVGRQGEKERKKNAGGLGGSFG